MTLAIILAVATIAFVVIVSILLAAVVVAKHFDKPAPNDMRVLSFPRHVAHYDGLWPAMASVIAMLALVIYTPALSLWALFGK